MVKVHSIIHSPPPPTKFAIRAFFFFFFFFCVCVCVCVGGGGGGIVSRHFSLAYLKHCSAVYRGLQVGCQVAKCKFKVMIAK